MNLVANHYAGVILNMVWSAVDITHTVSGTLLIMLCHQL